MIPRGKGENKERSDRVIRGRPGTMGRDNRQNDESERRRGR